MRAGRSKFSGRAMRSSAGAGRTRQAHVQGSNQATARDRRRGPRLAGLRRAGRVAAGSRRGARSRQAAASGAGRRRPGSRQPARAAGLAERAAGQPGIAHQALHDLRRPRPARPGLDLDDAGLAAGPRAGRRAGRQPRDQGHRRSEARARAPLADAAPRPAARRARDPRRHRARPQRLRRARTEPGRFRRRAAAAVQRRCRCAAAQLQVGRADLHARRAARRGAGLGRSAARRRAGRRERAAEGHPVRRLACCVEGRFQRPGAHRLRRPARAGLRREGLAGRLRRSEALQRARPRGPVARDGRPVRRHGARRQCAGLGADLRADLAAARRRDPRHQQVQQQPDGAGNSS